MSGEGVFPGVRNPEDKARELELQEAHRRGRLLLECVRIVSELADMPQADNDSSDDSSDYSALQELILKARAAKGDGRFAGLAG